MERLAGDKNRKFFCAEKYPTDDATKSDWENHLAAIVAPLDKKYFKELAVRKLKALNMEVNTANLDRLKIRRNLHISALGNFEQTVKTIENKAPDAAQVTSISCDVLFVYYHTHFFTSRPI